MDQPGHSYTGCLALQPAPCAEKRVALPAGAGARAVRHRVSQASARGPMAAYWIVLAPLIGAICVASRWREIEDRDERMHLVWKQVLHWAAVLVAMHLMFVADVARMMNSDASALAVLTLLALGTFTAGVHIGSWRICLVGATSCDRRSRHRLARTVRASAARGRAGRDRGARAAALARAADQGQGQCRCRRRLVAAAVTARRRSPACRADWRRRGGGGRRATAAVRRPSDQSGSTSTTWPRRRSSFDGLARQPALDHQHARARGARPERDREMLGVPGRRVDRLLQVHAGSGRGAGTAAWSIGPAGRRRASPRRGRARRRAAPCVGDSVVRGRLPGASEAGWPSSSQNICARVPRQKPSSGITGEDCSQPPDGVADTMLPAWSTMSKCTVSPRTSPMRPTVGSPAPMPATTLGRRPRSLTTAPKPSTEPGRSSSEALLGRRACGARRCRRPTAASSIGTSTKSGSP